MNKYERNGEATAPKIHPHYCRISMHPSERSTVHTRSDQVPRKQLQWHKIHFDKIHGEIIWWLSMRSKLIEYERLCIVVFNGPTAGLPSSDYPKTLVYTADNSAGSHKMYAHNHIFTYTCMQHVFIFIHVYSSIPLCIRQHVTKSGSVG